MKLTIYPFLTANSETQYFSYSADPMYSVDLLAKYDIGWKNRDFHKSLFFFAFGEKWVFL